MSWFGHTFLVVIQEAFMDRLWEPDPKKAAEIIRKQGDCNTEARYVEGMTPERWLETCHLASVFEAE